MQAGGTQYVPEIYFSKIHCYLSKIRTGTKIRKLLDIKLPIRLGVLSIRPTVNIVFPDYISSIYSIETSLASSVSDFQVPDLKKADISFTISKKFSGPLRSTLLKTQVLLLG